jgi:hypothetical protein
VASGFAFGVLATALDFGGWNEIDWRAALLAAIAAFGAIGVMRLVRMRST